MGKTYGEYLKEYQSRSLEGLNNSFADARIPNEGEKLDCEKWAQTDEADLKEYWGEG